MPVSMGTHPRHLEELRLGGGYDSTPDGGADADAAGNLQSNGDLAFDGTGSIGGNFTVGGDLNVGGLDTTWHTYLPANMGMPDPALPCGAVTPINWRNYQVATPSLAFDPDSPQAAFFQFRLPNGYDGRPLNFTLEWSANTGTAGDVRWGILPISFVDGDSFVKLGNTTYQLDSFIGVDTLHTCSFSAIPTTFSEYALTTVRVIRLSNHGSDTFGSSSLLLGLGITL